MAFSKQACSRIALGSIILLLMSSMGVAGLSTWDETAKEFQTGDKNNTVLDDGVLTLGTDPAFSGNWTKVGDLTSPAPRTQFTMIYDSLNKVHILHGGGRGSNYNRAYIQNETWVYDLPSRNWTKQILPGLWPSPVMGQAMIFDSDLNIAVSFGGFDDMNAQSYTFTYNYSNNTCIDKNPYPTPSGRGLHSMVYDLKNKMVILFGGAAPQTFLPTRPYDFDFFSDTYTYDVSLNKWTDMRPPEAPLPRCGQSMCYDPSSGQIILFGGLGDQGVYGDTWTYNLTSNRWSQRYPTMSPPARMGAMMATDDSGKSIILFGGQSKSAFYNDTWSYDIAGNIWTKRTISSSPSPRAYAAMTYDQVEKQMLLFGGNTQNGDQDDYWIYDPAGNSWEFQGELMTPEPRINPSAAYDSVRGVGVLFGGFTRSGPLNDTWTYNTTLNKWTEMHPLVSPPATNYPSMCYDPDEGLMLLVGGTNYMNDMWAYNVSIDKWILRTSASSTRWDVFPCMVYDKENQRAIIYRSNGFNYSETWTYSVTNNSWIDRTGPVAPRARFSSSMVYDDTNHLVIMFGGVNQGNNTGMNDTWILDPNTFEWTQRTPALSPPGRYGHSMCSDSSRSSLLLFGGYNQSQRLEDTWEFNASDNTWTNITPVASPSYRRYSAMFYDTFLKIAVLFGGASWDYLGDTWVHDLNGRFASGTYTSTPKNTGGTAYFGSLQWNSSIPSDTTLKFQIRTGTTQPSLESKNFSGPDSTPNSYFNSSGQLIPSIHNASRWIQYRAYLTTDYFRTSPALTSVSIHYNLLHELSITSPSGAANWTGIQNITWSSFDKDNDPLLFDIYLENGFISIPLTRGLPNGSSQWSWNTDATPNGTYRIRITARDDNPSIPLAVNATSGNFTIWHPLPPPPNHQPHVMLISPANNSYLTTESVRLQWIGTDPDGDSLTYLIHYSDSPLPLGTVLTNISSADHLDLSNLIDNKTYYWTVDASDGKSAGTDIPTDIWSFTIRLPPANIPVRITSTPPQLAWVGQEYTYNITSTDEDGDIPFFTIVTGPSYVSLNSSSGTLRWTPSASDIGNHTVVIQVSDGRGSTDRQIFNITVLDIPVLPVLAPKCTITYPVNDSLLKGVIQVQGTALNGSLPLRLIQVRIDGSAWSNAIGLANWTFSLDTTKLTVGKHIIEARAFDGNLSSDPASVEFTVRNPEPNVTTGGSPWCLPSVAVATIAGISVFLLLRKKKG